MKRLTFALAVLFSGAAAAIPVAGESPRSAALEIKLGGFKPQIDSEGGLTGKPYDETFGASAMLLFEVSAEKQLFQKYGSAGLGMSFGYAEKYGAVTVLQDPGDGTPPVRVTGAEKTGFQVAPIRAFGVYRLDYFAIHNDVPVVPYAKLGLVYTPWWVTKGSGVEFINGQRGAGAKWGYGFTGGVSFLLDFLEPRFARDMDSSTGINHTYLFGEYTYANVNSFGSGGLDLSSRHWMFGLTFEY